MKKVIVSFVAMIVTLASLSALADVTQTSGAIDVFINDADFKAETIEAVNELVADTTGVVAIANASALYRLNTNANVVVTNITPTKVGEILITPNATNVFTIAGTGATNTYTLRAAIATGTSVGNWKKLLTD